MFCIGCETARPISTGKTCVESRSHIREYEIETQRSGIPDLRGPRSSSRRILVLCHRTGEDNSNVHRLCRRLSGKSTPIRPLKAGDGTPHYRAEDRAEIFADYLETKFSPNPTQDVQHAEAIEKELEEYFKSPIASTPQNPIVFSPG
ncbi:jg9831 [Pararge aegeria aegeria]|uniref:Jg9831 protein n=1 Tax=Pararge aegeria aegeria TaxID=348720 RepID=A0A8S4QS04_9NEOP|nr:jg9831 [Pararge aegeria aegeria]